MAKSESDFIFDQPLLKQILSLALDKKAGRVVVFDVRSLSSVTDFFIICHGDSQPHV